MPRKAKERALELINSSKKKTKSAETTSDADAQPAIATSATSRRGRRRGCKKKLHWTQRRDRSIYKMEIKTRNVLEEQPKLSSATFSHMIWNSETKSYDIEWIATGKDDAKILQDLKLNAQMQHENTDEDDAFDSEATLSADEGRLMDVDVDVKADKIKCQRNSGNFLEFGDVEFTISHRIKQIEKDAPKRFVDKSTQMPAIEDVDPMNSAITSDLDMKVVKENDVNVKEKDINIDEKDIDVKEKDIDVDGKDVNDNGKDVNVKAKDLIVNEKDIDVKGKDIDVDGKDMNDNERDIDVDGKDMKDNGKDGNVKEKDLIVNEKDIDVDGKDMNDNDMDVNVKEKDLIVNEKDIDVKEKDIDVDGKDMNGKEKDENDTQNDALIVEIGKNCKERSIDIRSETAVDYDKQETVDDAVNCNVKVMNSIKKPAVNDVTTKQKISNFHCLKDKKEQNFHCNIDKKTCGLVNKDNKEKFNGLPDQTRIGDSFIIQGYAEDFKKAIIDQYNFQTMKTIIEKVVSGNSSDSSVNDPTLVNIGKTLLEKIDNSEITFENFKEDDNFLKFLTIEEEDSESNSSFSDTESDFSESEKDWSTSSTESDSEIDSDIDTTSDYFSLHATYERNSYFNCGNNNENEDSDFEKSYSYPSHFRYNMDVNVEDSYDSSDFITSNSSDDSNDSDSSMNINENILENRNKLTEVENDYNIFASKLKEQIERLQKFTILPLNANSNETVTNEIEVIESEVLENNEKSQSNVENAAKQPSKEEMSLVIVENPRKRKLIESESETAIATKTPKTLPN